MMVFEPREMGESVLERVDGCVDRGEVDIVGVDFLLAGTSHVVKDLVEDAVVCCGHVAEMGSYGS